MTSNDNDPGELSPCDRTLIERIRDGDEEAATLLYDRYARRLFGLVKSRLGPKLASATEPQDIVQSVFKSVFRGMQSGHYDAPPGQTLWNLIAVIAIHKLKKKASHHFAQRRDANRNLSLDQHEMLIAGEASVESFQAFVRETLEALRPLDRKVLSMRIEGHEISEIAEKIDRSQRTVERSLHKSRNRLASLLLEQEQ